MSIHKSPKAYTIRWYGPDGRERQKTYQGIDYQEAVKIERKLLAARDQGEAFVDPRRAPTFAVCAEAWLAAGRVRWKSATRARYEELLRARLLPRFGTLKITAISEEMVNGWLVALVDEGLSARRVNLLLVILKAILRTKLARKALVADPTRDVKPLREPAVEVDPLGPDDITRLPDACRPWWRLYFAIAFLTGCRPGELAGLRWGDYDEPAARLRVRRQRGRHGEGDPKTKAGIRDVDLMAAAVEALERQRAQQAAQRARAGQGMPAPKRTTSSPAPKVAS